MKNKWLKKLIIVGGLLAATGIGFWYYSTKDDAVIYNFNRQRDSDFVIDMWHRNWYWLVTGGEFSPEYVEKYILPQDHQTGEPKRFIKVMYKNNEPVGFVSYKKKRFYVGYINSLGVDDQFRSKGYGKKLIKYALQDLKKRGAIKVELFTRTTNTGALKIYKSLNFDEVRREDGYVYLEKML